jgi:hypothetical protein
MRSNLIIHESPDQQFPPECECGDRFLVGVTVVHHPQAAMTKQSGVYTPKTRIDWSVIVATETGWDDTNGDSWGAWSPDDVTFWAKLPMKPKGLEVCEHGIRDGEFCEECNKAMKEAVTDPGNDIPTALRAILSIKWL